MGKLLKCHLKGKSCTDSILIILKKKKKKWPKGFICPYTGTIFYNIRIYSRSQVSVYRTIGPLVRVFVFAKVKNSISVTALILDRKSNAFDLYQYRLRGTD